MKTLEELKEFYTNELSADLQRLETKRKQVMRNTMITAGVALVLGLVVFGIMAAKGGMEPFFLLFIAFGGAIIGGIAFKYIGSGYKREFKEQIIRKLIVFVNPELNYFPSGFINKNEFCKSKLFNHSVDRYKGEDLVRGRIDKTEITFCELHAEYAEKKTRKKSETEWHTIFKGLFFIADFNKYFQGQTVVLPDTAEKLFGGLGKMLQSWNVARADLIKLEDPEFEKEFVVYGNDQIESRYILSTSLMQRIMEFKRKTGTKIHLSFVGSRVYVAVSLTKNLFEPKYLSSLVDFGPIHEYYQDLMLAVGIVDDLNLNTRIWSKE